MLAELVEILKVKSETESKAGVKLASSDSANAHMAEPTHVT